ncbi:hypothetical protein AWENTII_012652 [Aspergillus wentii]
MRSSKASKWAQTRLSDRKKELDEKWVPKKGLSLASKENCRFLSFDKYAAKVIVPLGRSNVNYYVPWGGPSRWNMHRSQRPIEGFFPAIASRLFKSKHAILAYPSSLTWTAFSVFVSYLCWLS